MSKYLFTMSVAGLIAGPFLMGCGKTSEQKIDSAQKKVGGATQQLKDARTEYLAEWETFKRESGLTIAANEKRIDAFKEKMEHAGSRVKAKYSKEVSALEEKNRELKTKLAEYKNDGQSNWQEFKTNFKRDMDAMGKTIEDLFKDTD